MIWHRNRVARKLPGKEPKSSSAKSPFLTADRLIGVVAAGAAVVAAVAAVLVVPDFRCAVLRDQCPTPILPKKPFSVRQAKLALSRGVVDNIAP